MARVGAGRNLPAVAQLRIPAVGRHSRDGLQPVRRDHSGRRTPRHRSATLPQTRIRPHRRRRRTPTTDERPAGTAGGVYRSEASADRLGAILSALSSAVAVETAAQSWPKAMDRSKKTVTFRECSERKRDSPLLPERPAGCCVQKGTVPFSFPPFSFPVPLDGQMGKECRHFRRADLGRVAFIV